jgi:hypothetical protein
MGSINLQALNFIGGDGEPYLLALERGESLDPHR